MDVQYETDFVVWSERQASLLHQHRFELETWGIDAANLVEEVVALARSERRELRSRLTVLLKHLLKWEYQPLRRGASWRSTILQQRQQIEDLLKASPSLRRALDAEVKDVYPRAREYAALRTGLKLDTFLADCPWTVAQVLDVNFWP
jgi:Domain of unknown function DUF29